MNLDFKILWIEDNTGWYEASEIIVEELLKTHCLKCKIDRKQNNNEIDFSQLTGNHYDLILMDYDLGTTSKKGNEIILNIRKEKILTDILFYSSNYNKMIEAVITLSQIDDGVLDGVYYSSRGDTFYEKIGNLIQKIISRSETPHFLRGFVLDGACNFENRVCAILEKCWSLFNEDE